MDDKSDTIEIHSFLIRESLLYTLLFVYFSFFLSFFICILKFKEIKNFCFGKLSKRDSILPLHTTNLKSVPERVYDKYKYTNLRVKNQAQYDSSTDQMYQSDDSDFKRNLAKKPLLSASTISKDTLNEADLITFPSLNQAKQTDDQSRRSRCGFKFKDRKCNKRDCRRKSLLSKMACKYYNKFRRPRSVDLSSSDQSTVCRYCLRKDPPFKETTSNVSPPTSVELNRDRALKCYQDFLENRFCKADNAKKECRKSDDADKIKEDLKRMASEAVSNATILTPRQLRKYEPFKAEIANPVIRPRLVGKDLSRENYSDAYKEPTKEPEVYAKKLDSELDKRPGDADLEDSRYVDLTKNLDKKLITDFEKKIVSGIDQQKQSDDEEDYNFLRLANDLKKKSKETRPDMKGREMIKSPKFYFNKWENNLKAPHDGQTNGRKSGKETSTEHLTSEETKKANLIPDVNKLFKEKADRDELDEFERQEVIRSKNENRNQKDKVDEKTFDSKPRITTKEDSLYLLDSSSSSNESEKEPRSLKNLNDIKSNVIPSDTKVTKYEGDTNGLINDNSIRPFVDRMKSEMKQLKPIGFKPLQTVYLKEHARQGEVSELKIARLPIDRSISPSLRSGKFFINKNVQEELMEDKSEDLIDLSHLNEQSKVQSNEQSKDQETSASDLSQVSPSQQTKSGFFSRLNLNNILNLKDKQIDKPSTKLMNVASIDKQSSKERLKPVNASEYEQIGKLDKLTSIDKQEARQPAVKKSQIPVSVEKFKRSKSLSLPKKALFGRTRVSKEDKVDKDLEKMFDLKFKKLRNL